MISNQILQSTLEGLKTITRIDLCLVDEEGNFVAGTLNEAMITSEEARNFAESQADSQSIRESQYFKVFGDSGQLEYILITYGTGDDVFLIGRMATYQIQCLLTAYKERLDQDNFIKNLLLDNLLLIDIINRAKRLRIETSVPRVVMLVETDAENNNVALETVRGFCLDRPRDFITAVDEKDIIIVYQMGENETQEGVFEFAKSLLSFLKEDGRFKAHIAYGTTVGEIKDVSRSYKEAKMSLDVGKIFFAERDIIPYSQLGIGRLIYQLPIPLCKMFIKEIFLGRSPEEFDEETLTTINKFFENSLNVSETSRQLYIHRNTLVYRLDKIMKTTGLDLRVFEDAITFKIALMVSKYMKYMEENGY
ncbi:MAG: helix-turn-helix domain-containing protein [Lachnospiraceae bacterium]|nr:helix-turn-helix domain-containing protein [Lachnospiraceae bacterium]